MDSERPCKDSLKMVLRLYRMPFVILSLDKGSGLLDPVKLTVNTNAVVERR